MPLWTPASWQTKKCSHYPDYPTSEAVEQVLLNLCLAPRLVSSQEVETLKGHLKEAATGRAFLLQAGDCAESFAECQAEVVKNKLALLHDMSAIIAHGLGCPVIPIGRIAGQYAKPRSNLWETRHEMRLPSYQGDMINAVTFTPEARIPNPALMQKAHACSQFTLSVMREVTPKTFTSHEALLLPYEQALTRHEGAGWYNLATHFPWIGYRTNALNGAHIEYARGISNPLALKIGPETAVEQLQQLVLRLNPHRLPNRLMVMTRLGVNNTARLLPQFIAAVEAVAVPVLWSCDPMHGNTRLTQQGIKTRYFNDIMGELAHTLAIHHLMGRQLGGVHLELTCDAVTECVGGECGIQEQDLKRAYTSLVDPRLNASQSIEIAHNLVKLFNKEKIHGQRLQAACQPRHS